MAEPTEITRYHIYLDYKGYQIDPRSYRVFPAPLMGTRFATGRVAYQNLDFWQVGALTDFTKGMNQKFLVDPSQYYKSEGIDVSKEGQLKLERDLKAQGFPSGVGYITARYRSVDKLWLGTSTGRILVSSDGITFTQSENTGSGKIYGFYEMEDYLYAIKGSQPSWRWDGSTWATYFFVLAGTLTFTNGSAAVSGSGTAFETECWPGLKIKLDLDDIWAEVLSVTDDTHLTLTSPYTDTGGVGYGHRALNDLYFVMVESDYAYGIFNDGIRQTTDGYTFKPAPPDPLWELPNSEGVALNALPIPRGFLIGSKRGAWIFIGGGSGVNIWLFPEYSSADNFAGMDKFGSYGVFSVEDQGIFYTDGAGIYPTNLNWREEPVAITKCKDILTSGWDMFALVSDGTDWYLARCNMINTRVPKYWWLVKKLTKIPCKLSSFSPTKVFIHYTDEACEKYNKISGPYQTSGYLISPLIDENLVLLQKLYNSLSFITSKFPLNTTVKLDYRLKEATSFPTSNEESYSGGGDLEKSYDLENPTLGVRLQIKLLLETADTSESPVVTDLLWKFILERPVGETDRKRNFHFSLIAEDEIEKLDFDKEELEQSVVRSRSDILTDIWSSRDKKELLNFVGADNDEKEAFTFRYTGSGTSCRLKIDRTNYKIITTVDSKVDKTISYKDIKIHDLVATLNALSHYTCSEDPAVPQIQSANDLVPVNELEIKGAAQIYYGFAVYAVIFNPHSPGQYTLSLEGRGSARVQISLREA